MKMLSNITCSIFINNNETLALMSRMDRDKNIKKNIKKHTISVKTVILYIGPELDLHKNK